MRMGCLDSYAGTEHICLGESWWGPSPQPLRVSPFTHRVWVWVQKGKMVGKESLKTEAGARGYQGGIFT